MSLNHVLIGRKLKTRDNGSNLADDKVPVTNMDVGSYILVKAGEVSPF